MSDGKALVALLEEHSKEVYALLLAITRNPVQAEDLLQEVFVLALRKRVRPGPQLRFWLKGVARRLAMNDLRKKRPRAVSPEDLERATVDDDRGSPIDQLQFDERLAAMQECIGGLKPTDRSLLDNRYARNRPLDDIAVQEEQTVGYLKQRLFRLRKRLAECIQKRLSLRRPDA